jgi:hypothetical protein
MTALRTPAAAVWLVLVAATSLSWWLGTDHGVTSRTGVGVVLMVVAFAKVHLVGRYFMELREAAPALRRAFDAYVGVVCALLVVLLLVL